MQFGAYGTVAQQQAFLDTMVPFLTDLASVERFAYFGDIEGSMVANGGLTPIGQAYVNA